MCTVINIQCVLKESHVETISFADEEVKQNNVAKLKERKVKSMGWREESLKEEKRKWERELREGEEKETWRRE